MSIKFIHTADVHIGVKFESASFSGKVSIQRRREIKETFFKILKRAKEHCVDLLFIAGDLFEDEYITPGELKEIRNGFEKLIDTKIVIIAGNHDPVIAKSKYNMIEFSKNVYIVKRSFEKLRFDDLNVDIYALSWNKLYIEETLLDEVNIEDKNRINILIAHGDIYSKNSMYMPINREDLQKKEFDYAALGHVHKNDIIQNNIIYPGSPEPLDFGETGKHGIYEGTIDAGALSVDFIPFSKREYIIKHIEINQEMTRMDIIEKISKERNEKDLFRIILNGVYGREVDVDTSEMVSELSDLFFYVEIINNATEDIDITKIYADNKNNIIGEYIEEMKKKDLNDKVISEAFRLGLHELIKAKGE